MRFVLLTAATVLAAVPSAMTPAQSVERAFVRGGHVSLKLAAADYRISGSPDSRVRVSWWTNKPDVIDKVHVNVDVQGSAATVHTDAPKNGGTHFEIDLPDRCDLDVDLSAGD